MNNPWIVPIPGSTKTAPIIENGKAEDISFAEQEMKEINALLDTMDLTVFGR